MSMEEPNARHAEGAPSARVAKLRSLSIAREEPRDVRPTRASRLVVALVALLSIQALAIGYLVMSRGEDAASRDATVAPPSDEAPSPDRSVRPRAEPGPSGVKLQAQGFVVAQRQATVSTRVAGIVTALPKEVGDYVKAGEVVGVLDSDLARQDLLLAEKELSSLRSSVERERARKEQSNSELVREQQLAERNFSTSARISERKAAKAVADAGYSSAVAELAVGEVRVGQYRSLLSNYTIRAPFSGIIVEMNAQVGELVAPMSAGGSFTRTGICTIVDMDSLFLAVDVSEQQIGDIKVGQPVEFRLYADERDRYLGRVARILPSADRAKGTLQVRIAIDGADAKVLPGMRANVNFM